MSDPVFTLKNPSYAEYLQTPSGKIIAEQSQQIATLTARVAEMEAEITGWREGMSEAIDDLRSAGRAKAADMYHNVYFASADGGGAT
jgi:soluble cytochrome b562